MPNFNGHIPFLPDGHGHIPSYFLGTISLKKTKVLHTKYWLEHFGINQQRNPVSSNFEYNGFHSPFIPCFVANDITAFFLSSICRSFCCGWKMNTWNIDTEFSFLFFIVKIIWFFWSTQICGLKQMIRLKTSTWQVSLCICTHIFITLVFCLIYQMCIEFYIEML